MISDVRFITWDHETDNCGYMLHFHPSATCPCPILITSCLAFPTRFFWTTSIRRGRRTGRSCQGTAARLRFSIWIGFHRCFHDVFLGDSTGITMIKKQNIKHDRSGIQRENIGMNKQEYLKWSSSPRPMIPILLGLCFMQILTTPYYGVRYLRGVFSGAGWGAPGFPNMKRSITKRIPRGQTNRAMKLNRYLFWRPLGHVS